MARGEDAPDDEDPTVVGLTASEEVDRLAAERRWRICRYETGAVVEAPDDAGTIGARFVHDRLIGRRGIVASRESPTYIVKPPESEPPHPSHEEADLTEKER